MSFISIKPDKLNANTFSLIGKSLLLAAGDTSGMNAMTVSWGGLGVLWGKNVAACFVRPQRYTYEFIEKSDYYTLSAYPSSMNSIHSVFGTKSGRDTDKPALTGLTPAFSDCGAPYFEQAELVLVCKKMYFSDFDPKNFLDETIEKWYPDKDYHRMYIGEITTILKKD